MYVNLCYSIKQSNNKGLVRHIAHLRNQIESKNAFEKSYRNDCIITLIQKRKPPLSPF